ncbi:MAG TPA: tetratricopeptide repeat protein [Solimonas sp.]|nr:tetratricopeptide repeat protein [Solimonas sp.]
MTTHYDDEAQVENLKRWWKENWMALAAGLGIGLGAIFGWEMWKDHKTGQAEHASQIFEDMKKAATGDQADALKSTGDKLTGEFAASPYAADAALLLASEAVEQNRLDDALKHLQWVTANAKDEGIQRLAKLRQARVLSAQNKPDEALKLLEGEAGDYAQLYDELRGDIKLAQGDRAAARQAYEKALKAAGDNAGNRELLQRKLDDLTEAVQS